MCGEPAHAPRNSRETVEGVRTERLNCRANSDSPTIVVKSCAGARFRSGSWASKPEEESQHFMGKMRLGCANPRKAPHFVTEVRICRLGEERIETENRL